MAEGGRAPRRLARAALLGLCHATSHGVRPRTSRQRAATSAGAVTGELRLTMTSARPGAKRRAGRFQRGHRRPGLGRGAKESLVTRRRRGVTARPSREQRRCLLPHQRGPPLPFGRPASAQHRARHLPDEAAAVHPRGQRGAAPAPRLGGVQDGEGGAAVRGVPGSGAQRGRSRRAAPALVSGRRRRGGGGGGWRAAAGQQAPHNAVHVRGGGLQEDVHGADEGVVQARGELRALPDRGSARCSCCADLITRLAALKSIQPAQHTHRRAPRRAQTASDDLRALGVFQTLSPPFSPRKMPR